MIIDYRSMDSWSRGARFIERKVDGETAGLPQSQKPQQKDDDDDGAYEVNDTVHEYFLQGRWWRRTCGTPQETTGDIPGYTRWCLYASAPGENRDADYKAIEKRDAFTGTAKD